MLPDRTTRVERLLTWLGMWGVMRGFSALAAAIIGSVALLEFLSPVAVRLFPPAFSNAIHVFAVGIGLLLGLLGYLVADFWDRVVFDAWYGPHGRWLPMARQPLLVLPEGEPLKRSRGLAAQALPRKPETDAEIDREAIKVARRQVERWERIERPLILAQCVRGFLWPCVFVGVLACGGALAASVFGAATEAPRLLLRGGGCLLLMALLFVPYAHLRAEFLLRLYRDVAAHPARPAKRKAERR